MRDNRLECTGHRASPALIDDHVTVPGGHDAHRLLLLEAQVGLSASNNGFLRHVFSMF